VSPSVRRRPPPSTRSFITPTNRRDAQGALFGKEAVTNALSKRRQETADEIVTALMSEVEQFSMGVGAVRRYDRDSAED